ncbi:MAG: thioredoxin fold domain-containing protein [Arenicellales bacterium]|jgi:thioredoxin-related protein
MMMRVLALLLLTVFSLPSSAEPPDGYPFLPFDQAMQQAQEKGMPLFVYFGRYGCGYCDKTNKEAFSDSKVRQQYTANYVLAYVDSESGKRLRLPSGERITERELGTRYNAFVTPVFSFITTDGDVLTRLVGVQRTVDLLDADKKVQLNIKGQDAL